jgi:hypothetical protein
VDDAADEVEHRFALAARGHDPVGYYGAELPKRADPVAQLSPPSFLSPLPPADAATDAVAGQPAADGLSTGTETETEAETEVAVAVGGEGSIGPCPVASHGDGEGDDKFAMAAPSLALVPLAFDDAAGGIRPVAREEAGAPEVAVVGEKGDRPNSSTVIGGVITQEEHASAAIRPPTGGRFEACEQLI